MQLYFLGNALRLLSLMPLLLKALQANILHRITTCLKCQSCAFSQVLYTMCSLKKKKNRIWSDKLSPAREISTDNQIQPDLPERFPLAWCCSSILSTLTLICSSRGVYSHSFSLIVFFFFFYLLAYCSIRSTPEVFCNSLLISSSSCRIWGGGARWDQPVRTSSGTLTHSFYCDVIDLV